MKGSKNNYLWFLDTLVNIRVSHEDNSGGISVLQHQAYQNDSPPLHIHQNEDEIFYVLEGKFRFLVDDKEHHLTAGEVLTAPKGVPHSYIIESRQGGKWLTIIHGHDFEDFVKTIGRPAQKIELPQPSGSPSKEAVEQLTLTAKKFHIEIVGAPLH